MRSTSRLAIAAVGFLACTAPAAAWETHDRVHADSFGNLIVVAPSGFKRIIVGQGHLARQLQDYTTGDSDAGLDGAAEPDPADLEGIPEADAEPAAVPEKEARASGRPCPAILVKGRSYMYGFDEGVIPLFGDRCL